MQPGAPRRALGTVLREFVARSLEGLHTSALGVVRAYDAETQTIRVQPAVRLEGEDGQLLDPPVMEGVPVLFPSGDGFSASWTLAPDDLVWLMFAERTGAEVATGVLVAPGPERHALTNAIAMPFRTGVQRTDGRGWEVRKDDGSVSFRLAPDGIHLTGMLHVEGDVRMTGDWNLTGNLSATGDIDVNGRVDGVDVSAHKHATVDPGPPPSMARTSKPLPS